MHPHESKSEEDDREDVCLLGGGTSLIERTTDKALAFARSSHPDFDRTLPGPLLSMRPSSREWSRGLRSTAKKSANSFGGARAFAPRLEKGCANRAVLGLRVWRGRSRHCVPLDTGPKLFFSYSLYALRLIEVETV